MNYFFSNKITLENRKEIEEFVNAYPHETSGLTFTSLYMWRDQNRFSYEVINDYLCVAGYSNFEGFQDEPFIFPLLPKKGICDKKKLRDAMEEVVHRFREAGQPFVMRLVPPRLSPIYKDIMPGELLVLNDRANHDYVYLVDDLAELKGRKYHGKKSHLNRFNRELEGRYEIVPMSGALAEEALELLEYIDSRKQVEGFAADMLAMEKAVLNDIMPSFEELGFEGVALRIDGKLQAYAFGGRLGDDIVVEHVEKANIEYPGIYQKINSEFCKLFQGRCRYINREEDLGLEGLRKSKSSYKPFKMIEKCIIMMADDEEAVRRYSFDE
ncbi:MAG: DUF2156 domain-containing protein [Firmicutes bacterium]|nr:DUF2156 domain-containing protein [Bacillota bacterium]